MSILDDAIREHLELKRAHGADDAEVKRLEDEAFGPPQRPDEIDPFAEAPTEFLVSPGETPADAPEIADEGARSGRRPNITDLQEPPPADAEALTDLQGPPADAEPGPSPAEPTQMPSAPPDDAGVSLFDVEDVPDAGPVEDEHSPAADAPPPSPADAADLPLPPPGGAPSADLAPPTGETPAPPAAAEEEEEEDEVPAPPAEEEHPAGEHEVIVDAGPDAEEPGPDAEEPGRDAEEPDAGARERDAIVDQPTQMFDVQAHVDAEAAAATPATGEQAGPTDEELVDAAREEPRAAPPAPEADEPEEGSAEFDFFNEQRLSDELDQALEAPLPPTDEHLAMPRYKDEPGDGGIFDFESQEKRPYEDDPSQEVLRRADEAEAAEEPAADDEDETEYDPDTGHEDVLEDTPRFLEDAPEDDDLWFEQKPPKDFDLD